MQILFHIGAHATDQGLLIRSILRNRGDLSKEGIIVPGPSRYRELIGNVSTTLRGEPASSDTEELLLEAIGDDDHAERIVLSNEHFLCRDSVVLSEEGLYPKAQKSAWLRNCFPSHDVEFAIALRNPATLVPDILARLPEDEQASALERLQLERLRWLDVIIDIAASNPETPLLVWCHEEAPFIWGDLIRELTAHDPSTRLVGDTDMLEQLMSHDGVSKLSDFLESQGSVTREQRIQAITAFLDAHAAEDLEAEIDLPGWTADTVRQISNDYDEDIAAIAEINTVTMVRA